VDVEIDKDQGVLIETGQGEVHQEVMTYVIIVGKKAIGQQTVKRM
jgi:hypothetical protein